MICLDISLQKVSNLHFHKERLGIWWTNESPAVTWECVSTYTGLQDIGLNVDPDAGIYNSLVSMFEIELSNDESTVLFQETNSFAEPQGLGVWNKPEAGGMFKNTGGQFVFISGRPYRYNTTDLRVNMQYILDNFFNESMNVDVESDETTITHFALK